MERDRTRARQGLSLKAILFADAVQYTRLVMEDEQSALGLLRDCFELFRRLSPDYHGRLIKTTGDGALVEFDSAVAAVEYAVAAQHELARLNAGRPARRQARFRMGIHLGEVLYEAGDLYGHIVNIAARLEACAPPGGICVSQAVYEQTRDKISATFKRLAPTRLKNMAGAVVVYEVLPSRLRDAVPGAAWALINVLGPLTVSDAAGEPVPVGSAKACALLGYLALSRNFTESRTRLAGLLCSDVPAPAARKGLNAILAQARTALKSLGPDLLVSDRDGVRLASDRISVDLLALAGRVEEGEIGEALLDGSASPDRLLDGLESVDPAFASWLRVTRHVWRDRLTEKLEAWVGEGERAPAAARRSASALLGLDPTHERACRTLMQCHFADGNVAAALRVYREFCRVLRQEFSAEPSDETRRLMEHIRQDGQATAPVGAPGETAGRRPRPALRLPAIALGPLLTPPRLGKQRYLFEGFRRELLTSLVRFRGWIVIELESEPGAAGDKPYADYRIDTHCGQTHSGIGLTVTLVDLQSKGYVWSETYSMALKNWLAAQRDIIRRIATCLDIYLSTERLSGRMHRRDLTLDAYDDWLRGEELGSRWTPDNYREAERLFKSVMDRMPRFAPGYSSLADLYNTWHLALPGAGRDPERQDQALRLAEKAVEIDPLEARAQLTLAWSCAMAARFEKANLHYELAYELNPNNLRTIVSCAQGFAFMGMKERAQELLSQARALNPFLLQYQWAYVAAIHFACGEYQECAAAADRAGDAILDVGGWKAAALGVAGRTEEAEAAAREFVEAIKVAWTGPEPCTGERAVAWFLDSLPLQDRQIGDDLRRGLQSAGLTL